MLYLLHTSHRKPLETFPWFVDVIWCSPVGPASHQLAEQLLLAEVLWTHWEIRGNSGNHFQLPSSDFSGTVTWRCVMGLDFSTAKRPAITATLTCLPTVGIYF